MAGPLNGHGSPPRPKAASVTAGFRNLPGALMKPEQLIYLVLAASAVFGIVFGFWLYDVVS
jgi:hypothetical protein